MGGWSVPRPVTLEKDVGMKSLAAAIESGALPTCRAIVLDGNPGDITPVRLALQGNFSTPSKNAADSPSKPSSRPTPTYATPTAGKAKAVLLAKRPLSRDVKNARIAVIANPVVRL